MKTERNKGIIFTFDAVFALLIVVVLAPIVLLLSIETSSETTNQKLLLQAEDAINTLSDVRVRDVISEPVISDLYAAGVVHQDDLDLTLIEFVNTLWASNSTDNNTHASNITNRIFSGFFPPNVQWSLAIENDTVYETAQNFTRITTISRRITSGFRKGLPSAGFVASTFLTSIGGKRTSSYFFFGGFVSHGNITAQVADIPTNTNVTEIYMELNALENFTFNVNGIYCASLNLTPGNFSVNNWTINSSSCLTSVVPGIQNNFTYNFTGGNLSNEYIGGGYLRVTYSTDELLRDDGGLFYYRFPGINGLMNLYDSFYIPGNVSNVTANITIFTAVNYTTFLYFGNATVLNHTGTGQKITLELNDSDIRQALAASNITYIDLSSATTPLRMVVLANITGGTLNGTTDVVLITDVSGSMAWRLNQDFVAGNTINNCNDPAIYLSTTSRISLAKCLDKFFINAVLGGNTTACGGGTPLLGNRVGLVAFSTSANNWESLATNITYLESRINAYTASGGTCISCAINRAYQLLANQSSPGRDKYIVVMTDGVANYRSTPICYDFNDISENVTAGEVGATAARTQSWTASNLAGASDNFNDISFVNHSFGRAVADGGEIYYWNTTDWTLEQDTGTNDIYGVELFNETFGFAVGASAKIWRWNGATWSQDADLGNFDINSISFLNSTFAFAPADNGEIYRWNGAGWSLYQDVGGEDLFSVDLYNSTLGFIVGTSGKIYKWNGTAWPQDTDTGSNTHNDVFVLNGTKAFTASSNGRVYEWDGSSWTSTLLSSYDLQGVYAINTTLAFATGDSRGDIYQWDGSSWSRTRSAFYYQGLATSGISCNDDDTCSLSVSDSYSTLNTNYSAHYAFTNLPNLTIDSVGFGPISTCNIGNETITEIARSGNGTAYSSSDASELLGIYCQIALNIITKTTPTQQFTVQGNITEAVLYPESFVQFNYTTGTSPPGYQEITISAETPRFAGCDGQFFLPPGINVTNALRTSYSSFYWTKNVYVNNSLSPMVNVYNLTKFRKSFVDLGDPFKVYIPSYLLAYNETNLVNTELGLNTSFLNISCSNYDRVIYTARLRASVPTGGTFPQLSGGIVRVYYDIDHDGAQDGYTDLTVGSNLPNFNPAIKTVDQLDPANNALDDALLRLLSSLNSILGSGLPGSSTNPIDIQLSDVQISVAGTGGVPFSWGPIDVRFEVGI